MLKIHTISNFRKLLKNKENITFPILFYGPEEFLIKDTIDKIIKLFNLKRKIYFLSEIPLEEIIKNLSNFSLFEDDQENSVYICFEAEKTFENINTLKSYLKYLKQGKVIFISKEDIIPPKLLVYYFKGKDISAYIKKELLEILSDFLIIYSPKIKKEKIKTLILQKFSKYKINLSEKALEKLLEITTDLFSLKNETDKLILYALETKKKILDENDIEKLCVGFDFDFWETLNLYLEGDYKKFIKYFEKAYRENPYLSIPFYLGRLKNIIKGKTSYDKIIFQRYKSKVLKLYSLLIDLDIFLRQEYNLRFLLERLIFEKEKSNL